MAAYGFASSHWADCAHYRILLLKILGVGIDIEEGQGERLKALQDTQQVMTSPSFMAFTRWK